jgi:alpha-N-acetylglucosamine transferase
MNFCKKCNYVLNITKKQLDENEKNHYKIATLEAFLNYIKHDMNEANQTVDIKISNHIFQQLKTKLNIFAYKTYLLIVFNVIFIRISFIVIV